MEFAIAKEKEILVFYYVGAGKLAAKAGTDPGGWCNTCMLIRRRRFVYFVYRQGSSILFCSTGLAPAARHAVCGLARPGLGIC